MLGAWTLQATWVVWGGFRRAVAGRGGDLPAVSTRGVGVDELGNGLTMHGEGITLEGCLAGSSEVWQAPVRDG